MEENMTNEEERHDVPQDRLIETDVHRLIEGTTQDKLTPEILTAAGWIKWHENDAVVNFEKEVDDVYFNLDFRKRIKKIDIQVDNCIKARLNNITVEEFNTLLDIVKLNKFKINMKSLVGLN